jgi:hypothetical protein
MIPIDRTTRTAGTLSSTDPRRRRLAALGRLLDDSIPIPGTRRRIGVDVVIGLVPGVGDAVGTLLSAIIIVEAARFGVSRTTLLRMAGNVGIEALVGVVPVVGDLFDAGWKANLRNLKLLNEHFADPLRATRASRRFVLVTLGAVVLLLLGIAALAVWLGSMLLGAITTL